jgi:hypothetical protein
MIAFLFLTHGGFAGEGRAGLAPIPSGVQCVCCARAQGLSPLALLLHVYAAACTIVS